MGFGMELYCQQPLAFLGKWMMGVIAIRDAGDSGVVASRVVMGIRLDDLPDKPDMGDCIMLDNLTYYVQEVQVDGQGGAHLVLNHAEV